MKTLSKVLMLAIPVIGIASLGILNTKVEASGSDTPTDAFNNNEFPRDLKYLFPPPVPLLSDSTRDPSTERVAYGAVDPTEELEQPIAYSHKLHAGEMKIECQYCHTYAKRSIHAGIPSTQICMNCHDHQPETGQARVDPTGRPELYKLLAYNSSDETVIERYANADGDSKEEITAIVAGINPRPKDKNDNSLADVPKEIPWAKVHDLPDFVYFTHKRHVKAGLECQECHGEVQDDMTVARRVSELTMGWCLNCHESHPSIQENYCTDSEIEKDGTCQNAELRRTEIKDCYTCHK